MAKVSLANSQKKKSILIGWENDLTRPVSRATRRMIGKKVRFAGESGRCTLELPPCKVD
jgi:hypothetical protein